MKMLKEGYYSITSYEYFHDWPWGSLLPHERELFSCLGWNDHLWEANRPPDSWHASWKDITLEMQVCASTLLYDESSWNKKPDSSSSKECEEGVVYVSISSFVNYFDF